MTHFRPLPTMTTRQIASFWKRVAIAGPDDCWDWQGYISPSSGYGTVGIAGHNYRAHRVAYFLATGHDPGPLNVLHRCDRRCCQNPAHHFEGTHADNVADCKDKGRLNRASGDHHASKTCPTYVRRGERHHWATITADDVLAIRAAYATGSESYNSLARRFGVQWWTVRSVVKRHTWKHVQ